MEDNRKKLISGDMNQLFNEFINGATT